MIHVTPIDLFNHPSMTQIDQINISKIRSIKNTDDTKYVVGVFLDTAMNIEMIQTSNVCLSFIFYDSSGTTTRI